MSTSNEPTSAAEAAVVVASQDRARAVRGLAELRRRSDGAQERARRARRRFEDAVAIAASSRPAAADWWAHPGAIARPDLLSSCQLTTMQLHRVMERYRTRHPAKAAGARRAGR
jgi:hypothetical protein